MPFAGGVKARVGSAGGFAAAPRASSLPPESATVTTPHSGEWNRPACKSRVYFVPFFRLWYGEYVYNNLKSSSLSGDP